MTITRWYRSVINGWRMRRQYTRRLRSLRPTGPALGLPVQRMSDDEVEASVAAFSRLAWMSGVAMDDVAVAVRQVKEAHARARRQDGPGVHSAFRE